MLRLTSLLGIDVRHHNGEIGRLWDIEVSREGRHPAVVAVWARKGRSKPVRHRWDEAAAIETGRIRVGQRSGEPGSARGLLLREHVLDSQVVDLAGKRLTRVGDVLLAGPERELRLAGVEIGARPVLRRLGLGLLAPRTHAEEIDWGDVHLASTPGHALQLEMPLAAVHRLSEEELSALASALPPSRAEELLRATSQPAPRKRPHRALGKRFGDVMRVRRRAPR